MTVHSSDTWQARARWELALRDVGEELADTRLAQVQQHCAETGQHPEESFGTPEDFAADVATDLATEGDSNRDPEPTEDLRLNSFLLHLGYVAVLFGAVCWLFNGLVLQATPGGLATAVLVCSVVAGVHVVENLRGSGRPRATPWAIGGVAAAGTLAVAAFQALPNQALFPVPAPLLIVLGLAAIGCGFARKGKVRPQRSGQSTEQWLADLAGLLEGRHDLPRKRAAELTAEAAAHLRDTGRTPQEEFGTVENYAQQRAEHETTRPPWWRRDNILSWLRIFGPLTLLIVNIADDGAWWFSIVLVLAICTELWHRLRHTPTNDE